MGKQTCGQANTHFTYANHTRFVWRSLFSQSKDLLDKNPYQQYQVITYSSHLSPLRPPKEIWGQNRISDILKTGGWFKDFLSAFHLNRFNWYLLILTLLCWEILNQNTCNQYRNSCFFLLPLSFSFIKQKCHPIFSALFWSLYIEFIIFTSA